MLVSTTQTFNSTLELRINRTLAFRTLKRIVWIIIQTIYWFINILKSVLIDIFVSLLDPFQFRTKFILLFMSDVSACRWCKDFHEIPVRSNRLFHDIVVIGRPGLLG